MFKKPKEVAHSNPVLRLEDCLAKTYGAKLPGRKVLNHCRIVGEVARSLLRRMPARLVDDLFPPGSELIAASHDIGKVCPTFQEKIYRGTQSYAWNTKPGLENANPELEKQWGGHAGVSQAAAQDLKLGKYIADILGQHHGYSPNVTHLATDAVFGGAAWQKLREELVADLQAALHSEFPLIASDLQARLLAGLTTVCDWIGSGSLFDDPNEPWRDKIDAALDAAGFVAPKLRTGLSFGEIFGFQARNAQQTLIDSVTQPGVYVLEAPMGLGKTEAALYAAYNLLAANQASGIYFALPTQLTSDKIHARVDAFLERVLVADSAHRQPLLLHSNAWLKQTELGVEGQPGGAWFQAGKRGILAPFAVGTVDQALMAVMNVKHGFVRTFGLAGKVVILDEVHSYDSYTGTLLDALVQALRQLHCTVIILSATLTRQRRNVLLNADSTRTDYPLISAAPGNGALSERPAPEITDADVAIVCCGDDLQALEEALLRAEQGQQVLWIENTVAEAQQVYRTLAARGGGLNIECGLLHSRFLKCDRETNETQWVGLFGKEGAKERAKAGRILVGTQVLEQSLDIDADFLVSRIAPSDMLLQRIGRLWRHENTPRPDTARREAWLLMPALQAAIDAPEQAFGNSAKIYSPYVLCRSIEVWRNRQTIAVPGQIRALIEATYAEREEAGPMLRYLGELQTQRENLQRHALLGLSKAGKTLPEEKAATRYGEQDSVEVLLLHSYRLDGKQAGAWVEFLDGEQIFLPANGRMQEPRRRRELAAKLLQNTVRVADYLAPRPAPLKNLNWLQDYVYLGNAAYGESLMRVAKVHDSGEILSLDGGVASDRYCLQYDATVGYQAQKA